ncbi:MAG: polyprenyl synthetase family protein [Sphaerochaetaceae bacterium]|jgi:octaprenyl-diphosphate synthase
MDTWLQLIEEQLYKILPPEVSQKWATSLTGFQVDEQILPLYDQICQPARDLVYRKGKRWRPLLLLLIAKMIGGKEAFEKALPLTPLVELPHNGSLIIDDIEDDAILRRGKEAIHLTYGTDISINGGNFLYYLPTLIIGRQKLSESKKLQLYEIYANHMRKIHLGQGMDIIWHREINIIPPLESYKLMCRLKTGCLAAMGAQLGGAVATEDLNLLQKSSDIAQELGLAFQIVDDIINLERGNKGKNQGDDIVENKKSLPIILYAQNNSDKLDYLFATFKYAQQSGYNKAKNEILKLIESIRESGALNEAKSYSDTILQNIVSEIKLLFNESEERRYLIELIESFPKN